MVENIPLLPTAIDDYLTLEEEKDRLFLERKVERAFWEAGRALKELRDRRLYRSTHKTFEEYCRSRFNYSRRKMDYLIAGSEVFDNLQMRTIGSQNPDSEMRTIGSQNPDSEMRTIGSENLDSEMRTIGSQILPTNERQVRPLTELSPSEQWEVWSQALSESGGKVPSSRIVKDIVQRIKEKTRLPNPYHVGEVCLILAKDDPELRGKGGCWCIISEVHEFSCTVKTWFGEITIRTENLKLLDYSTQECKFMSELCECLHQLYSEDLEETALAILNLLGKLNRPYLTAFEKNLLSAYQFAQNKLDY